MAICDNCGAQTEEGEELCPECRTQEENSGGKSEAETVISPTPDALKSKVKKVMQKEQFKLVTPVIFVLALLCLFLPFATISCNGHELATLSSFDMATGAEIQEDKTGFSIWALFLILVILAGLALSFWKSDKRPVFFLAISAAGLAILLAMVADISAELNEVRKEFGDIVKYQLRAGFYLLFLLFLLSGGLNVLFLKLKNNTDAEEEAD